MSEAESSATEGLTVLLLTLVQSSASMVNDQVSLRFLAAQNPYPVPFISRSNPNS